jgi:hypothetical protein
VISVRWAIQSDLAVLNALFKGRAPTVCVGCGPGYGRWHRFVDHLKSFASFLQFEAIKIVSHPPALGFYWRIGAEQEGFVPPSGRVTWERPLLKLRVRGN